MNEAQIYCTGLEKKYTNVPLRALKSLLQRSIAGNTKMKGQSSNATHRWIRLNNAAHSNRKTKKKIPLLFPRR